MGSKDVLNFIKVTPAEMVTVKQGSPAEVAIENTDKKRVAYKLKTTRPKSVKPERTFGVIAKNGKATVKFQFKPAPDEKPFANEDRITILLSHMPASFSSPEKFWKSSRSAAADAKRIVLKLEKAGEKATPKKKKKQTEPSVKEEEEEAEEPEPTSEETEAEESEAESGASEA